MYTRSRIVASQEFDILGIGVFLIGNSNLSRNLQPPDVKGVHRDPVVVRRAIQLRHTGVIIFWYRTDFNLEHVHQSAISRCGRTSSRLRTVSGTVRICVKKKKELSYTLRKSLCK